MIYVAVPLLLSSQQPCEVGEAKRYEVAQGHTQESVMMSLSLRLHIPYSTTIRPPQTALILRSIKLTIVFFNKRTLHSNSYVKITADEIYVFCVTDKMKLAD